MPYGDLLADVVQGSTANTPPVFKDGNSTEIGTLCRAWVNFNGTGTVAIRASFNVSSITDNGTGDYRVNFATALTDANYSVVFNAGTTSTAGVSFAAPYNFTNTTSSCGITCFNNSFSATLDTNTINCAVFR